MFKNGFLFFVLAAFCEMAGPGSAAVSAPATPAFTTIVNQYFSQWDTDGSAALSPEEIDHAVANPQFKDEAAAAIGAIKVVVRGGKYNLPPLTKAYLLASPLTEPTGPEVDPAFRDDPAKPGKIDHPPSFQVRYLANLERLRAESPALFPQGLPALNSCHQGPLGDCYFVSVVGAMVYRSPQSVKDLFTANADGSTTVRFGNGRSVTLPPLTDAEVAISSSAGANGRWLAVLENAYGKIRDEVVAAHRDDAVDTDSIAKGGSPAPVIQALTGHATRFIAIVEANGQRRSGEPFATTLRTALLTATRGSELAGTGTPDRGTPPGVTPGHAYAILGYDANSGLLHLWNPHGNSFAPKGSPGVENGYVTQAGQFSIPFGDWLRVYHGATFETAALLK